MSMSRLLSSLGLAGLAFAAQACVVRDATPVNAGYGYQLGGHNQTGYAQGGIYVGEPSPYSVSTLPPQPLYENMTSSPGYGHVWIDGYWDWNGYEWVWMSGRWTQDRSGYYYVQPYYDYGYGGGYTYTPGYWTTPDRLPARGQVRDHRDGRPQIVTVPPQQPSRPGYTQPGAVYPPPSHQAPPDRAYDPRYPSGGPSIPSAPPAQPSRPTYQPPPSQPPVVAPPPRPQAPVTYEPPRHQPPPSTMSPPPRPAAPPTYVPPTRPSAPPPATYVPPTRGAPQAPTTNAPPPRQTTPRPDRAEQAPTPRTPPPAPPPQAPPTRRKR